MLPEGQIETYQSLGLVDLSVEEVFDVVEEVGGVDLQDVLQLQQEVDHVVEGQSFSCRRLLLVHPRQVAQLLVGLALRLVQAELHLRLELLDGDLADLEGHFVEAGALLLLGEQHDHDAGDLELALDQPLHRLDVLEGEVGVVDVVLGVGLEEHLLLLEGEGQALEGLVELLDGLGPLEQPALDGLPVELEEVGDVVDLLLGEAGVVEPGVVLEEGYVGLGEAVELDAEPDLLLAVELEDELEEGAAFEQLVADDVLDLGEDAEELPHLHVRVAADVLEGVHHRRLQLDQRLDRHLVDLLERLPVQVREVFRLELGHQLRLGALQVGLPQRAVLVQLEVLLPQPLVQQLLPARRVDHPPVLQAADHHRLLLAPGGLDAQQDVHVEQLGRQLLLLALALLQREGCLGLGLEVLHQQRVGDDLRAHLDLGQHLHLAAQLLDLLLVVLLVQEQVVGLLLHPLLAELGKHAEDELGGLVLLAAGELLLLEQQAVDVEVAVEAGLHVGAFDAVAGQLLVLVHPLELHHQQLVHLRLVQVALHQRVQLQRLQLLHDLVEHLELVELELDPLGVLALGALLLLHHLLLVGHRHERRQHDALDEGGEQQHDHHVVESEEQHDGPEPLADPRGDVVGHRRPAGLSQHLEEVELRVDEVGEVGVLVVDVVGGGRAVVGLLQRLHPDHPQRVDHDQEDRQQLEDDGQDHRHPLHQVLEVAVELYVQLPAAVLGRHLEEKTRPVHPQHSEEGPVAGEPPEELHEEAQHSHEEVDPRERLAEVVLRPDCYQLEGQLEEEEVGEDEVDHPVGLLARGEEQHGVDEGQQGDQGRDQPVAGRLHLVLESPLPLHVPPETHPALGIREGRRTQVGVFLEDAAELHELVDVEGGVVVGVELEADAGHHVDEAHPVLVEVEQELDQPLHLHLVVLLPDRDERHYQRVLHLDLVQQLQAPPGLPEPVEDDRPRDAAEDEHVQEDEQDEEAVVVDVGLYGRELVVGVGVVGAQHVHDEHHPPQVAVVVDVGVEGHGRVGLDDAAAYYREDNDHGEVEHEAEEDVLVGRPQGHEGTQHLPVVEDGQGHPHYEEGVDHASPRLQLQRQQDLVDEQERARHQFGLEHPVEAGLAPELVEALVVGLHREVDHKYAEHHGGGDQEDWAVLCLLEDDEVHVDEAEEAHAHLPGLAGLPLVHSHVAGLLPRVDDVETGLLVPQGVDHVPPRHLQPLLLPELPHEIAGGLDQVLLHLLRALVLLGGLDHHVLALLHGCPLEILQIMLRIAAQLIRATAQLTYYKQPEQLRLMDLKTPSPANGRQYNKWAITSTASTTQQSTMGPKASTPTSSEPAPPNLHSQAGSQIDIDSLQGQRSIAPVKTRLHQRKEMRVGRSKVEYPSLVSVKEEEEEGSNHYPKVITRPVKRPPSREQMERSEFFQQPYSNGLSIPTRTSLKAGQA